MRPVQFKTFTVNINRDELEPITQAVRETITKGEIQNAMAVSSNRYLVKVGYPDYISHVDLFRLGDRFRELCSQA